MGNSCVGSRSSAANNGTRGSSVPSSYWWCCGYKYGSHACKCDKTNAKATETIQDMPPQIVRIESDEVKPPHRYKEEKPPSEQTRPQPRPQPRPHNVKKPASAGLKADSVLQRKTGNLKESYNLGKKLGQGQFGTTFLCVEKATGKEYACKSILKRKLMTEEDVEDVRREIQIMHHLAGSANVISIKEAFEDAVSVHVVMELCAGGELFDRIVERGHYSERKAAKLARTIVGVIESCHSLGVMHRDLKPENFLFVNQQEESPLKAIDFGLSAFFKPGLSKCFIVSYTNIFGVNS